ncbi:MAG TPA: DUF4835 family protein [Bacteroidales bacterium]|nr:DUF4835 family protein [Bacteroidales bacterium]HQH18651.1 DUF4835 family protein [Bacteroidales bacterium]
MIKILKYTYVLIIGVFLLSTNKAYSQELNCIVSVNTQQIQSSDKKIYETLQASIYEFMNSKKWTNYTYETEEKIECTIMLTISSKEADQFKGTLQVQSRRPIYKSAYNSVLLNMIDKDIQFNYIEYQPLDYNEGTFTSNLTSLLAYYANLIIGYDFDSYQLLGGNPYFEKAQSIITSAQSTADPGWKGYESSSQKNRYWLIENLLNNVYSPVREAVYNYHRKGLDMLIDNAVTGKAAITASFDKLKTVHENKPGSYLMQLFFIAKTDEILNIFTNNTISTTDKTKVVDICKKIDPTNSNKYNQINK